MRTKFKINNQELVLDIKFLYDVGFSEKKTSDIYKFVNRAFFQKNIKFNGKKIIVYIDGILIGTIYLTNYYLKKYFRFKRTNLINEKNSYYVPSLVVEI